MKTKINVVFVWFSVVPLLIIMSGCADCKPEPAHRPIHKKYPSTIPYEKLHCIPGRSGYGAISAAEIDAMQETRK